tara:strand:- start:2172 stop:3242 length:1071 start_codon:yes stop_codon:yes gene_type:complete
MGVRSLGNDPSSYKYKFGRTGLDAVGAPPPGAPITATGGNVEYTLGTNKIHVFTSPGTLSNPSDNVQVVAEYVLIAGGGGSAGDAGGGGGAGGVVSSIPGIMPVTRTSLTMNAGQSVTVTIGAGGPAGGAGQPDSPAYPGGRAGGNGEDTFYTGPAGTSTRALGGGGGGAESNTGPSNLPVPQSSGGRGGSGGGSRGGRPESANSGGLDNQGSTGTRAVAPALTPGIGGGGGGGAGGAAGNSVNGGPGIQLPPAFRDDTQPTAVKGDPGTYGGLPAAPTPGGWWFAGGGGGYTDNNYPIAAPYGGPYGQGGSGGGGKGANPPYPISGQAGQANTGGGAGSQAAGGSGIAFFYYPIA